MREGYRMEPIELVVELLLSVVVVVAFFLLLGKE